MAITATAASLFTFNNSLSSAPPLTIRPVFSSLHLSVTGKLGVFTNYSGHRKTLILKPPMCSVSVTNSQPMVPPYNVLITGSTKGIGYALAKEFLKAGDNVIICSRSAERVESALQTLRAESGVQHVWGTKCDVRDGNDVKNLVKYAQDNLKYVDIWINNAGSNAYSYKPLAEASDEDLIEVVTTNTLGLMICCREAMKMMLNQPRGGHIFNIDGAGSDGRPTPRFAAYGATKRSVVHLTKSLQAELRMQEVNNVVVHNLSVCCAFLAHINSYPSSHFPTHLQPLFDSSLHLRHPTTTFLVSLSLEVKKVVVIHDVLMSYVVQDVKTLTNAEMFVFQPPPAFYRACGLWEKAGGGQFPFNRTFPVERELMEKLPSKDGISSQEFRKLLEIQQSHMGSHVGELYDSSRVIEGEFIEYLEKDEINGKKKIWAVGPLNPIEISSKRTDSTSRHKCLQWLDKQPENSVMYVSFGTTTTFSEEQIRELALGLERSGQRFIWVVRVADTSNSVGSEERKIELPNGFEERVRGRGLIERSWAPQLEILEHSATGGFMSHCGWNSSMESISMGVPMATWPMHSDQPRNAFLITDVIKIGIAVKNWESRYELVKANVMADAINRLMASEEGAEIRRRAVKLGGEVKESVAEGGVRCREMDSFISYICS